MNSTSKSEKLLFLYSELSGYFLGGIRELRNLGYEIHIVRFPVNEEAPFSLIIPEGVFLYERSMYSYRALFLLVEKISPDFIFCSGWMDNAYVRICRSYKKKIPKVLALDNPWNGSFRQRLACLAKPFITTIFTHVWVAGNRQKEFALKLGFKNSAIFTGVYSADTDFYSSLWNENKENKRNNFPKVFLFAGRYNKIKGLDILLSVFQELNDEQPGWELWCAGAGELEKAIPVSKQIKNLGFLQTSEWKQVIARAGVFVLPSRAEPWGVAVHEFAAAGFPLICSDEVGANELFLVHEKNGCVFKSTERESLKKCFLKIILTDTNKLYEMGEQSHVLAMKYTYSNWINTIDNILTGKQG